MPLVVKLINDSGKMVEASAETVRIGRLRDCDICIAEHPTVSSVHALLFSRDGNLFIEDQKSSNGTFVNDEQIHGNVQLAVKDVIALGKTGPSLALADFSILQEPEFSKPKPSIQPVLAPIVQLPVEQERPKHSKPNSWSREFRELIAVQSKLRKNQILFSGVILLAVVAIFATLYLRPKDSSPQIIDGNDAYKRLMECTVLVTDGIQTDSSGVESLTVGSGVIIDFNGRILAITNAHVVDHNSEMEIFSPSYNGESLICDAFEIADSGNDIKGTVLVSDFKKDCAILELESVPPNCNPLSLATEPVLPGNTVHSVGHPGAAKAAWVYSSGKVKSREIRVLKFATYEFSGWSICTQSPINEGDSGGPIMNDQFQLVGINMGRDPNAEVVSFGVDLEEIRTLLNSL